MVQLRSIRLRLRLCQTSGSRRLTGVDDWPGTEGRVRASFARQGLMAHIGARLVSLAPGECAIACAPRAELSQQHGYVHAGVVAAIADSAAGYAAMSVAPEDSEVLTVEFKLNLLAPAAGDLLMARGRVVRAGRTLTVCESTVGALRDGEETPCAIALVTMMHRS
jgi:uncharacterized protein (TIGR00369 family)